MRPVETIVDTMRECDRDGPTRPWMSFGLRSSPDGGVSIPDGGGWPPYGAASVTHTADRSPVGTSPATDIALGTTSELHDHIRLSSLAADVGFILTRSTDLVELP